MSNTTIMLLVAGLMLFMACAWVWVKRTKK